MLTNWTKRIILKEINSENVDEIHYGFANTDVGELLIGILPLPESPIICLYLVTENREAGRKKLQKTWPKAQLLESEAIIKEKVQAIFYEENPFVVAICGSEFEILVWKALCSIPFGTTVTYSTIAEQINRPKAVRAVGNAVGRNEVCILIPCHRVLSKTGNKLKFGAGPEAKLKLLQYENPGINLKC